MQQRSKGRLFFIPAALALLLGGVGLTAYQSGSGPSLAHAAPLLNLGDTSIADVAERAAPSVVNIKSTQKVNEDVRTQMDQLFGPGFGGPGGREHQGLGSGVIVSADGYVLTNNHVVAKASSIEVVLADGREYDAKVVGADPKSDLAVIKLEGNVKGLQPIVFGDSSELRLGDVVLAIGNPFGVGQTVTMGIVSAKGRANMGIVDYEDFIQTDAAINPGNSGGALINMKGELVGINTAILSRSGGYQGIGFAIPTTMARPIMDMLVKDGKVVRGWLGVSIQSLNRDLAAGLGLKLRDGVLVSDVVQQSPAAKAGLQRGDVVVDIDGTKTPNAAALRNVVAMKGANQQVSLGVMRDGQYTKVGAVLGEAPQKTPAVTRRGGSAQPDNGTVSGMKLAPLDNRLRQRLSVPADIDGLVVTAVDPRSNAAKAGLEAGDLVLEVNRRPVRSLAQFEKMLQSAGKKVVLLIYRNGMATYVPLEK